MLKSDSILSLILLKLEFNVFVELDTSFFLRVVEFKILDLMELALPVVNMDIELRTELISAEARSEREFLESCETLVSLEDIFVRADRSCEELAKVDREPLEPPSLCLDREAFPVVGLEGELLSRLESDL
jgi:hypothetical protein